MYDDDNAFVTKIVMISLKKRNITDKMVTGASYMEFKKYFDYMTLLYIAYRCQTKRQHIPWELANCQYSQNKKIKHKLQRVTAYPTAVKTHKSSLLLTIILAFTE